jgi:hypothetical protein
MNWLLGLLLVALAALFVVGFLRHGRVFRAPPPDQWPSVFKLQLAGSGLAMAPLLERLGEQGRSAFRAALRIDDRMIVPGYAGFLAVASLLSILPIRAASSGGLEAVGVAAACLAVLLALAAGALDLVENRALRTVLDAWREIPMPQSPAEEEAAARQELRRQLVDAIDGPSRAAAAASAWKFRFIGLVLAWLLVAAVVAVTHALA